MGQDAEKLSHLKTHSHFFNFLLRVRDLLYPAFISLIEFVQRSRLAGIVENY